MTFQDDTLRIDTPENVIFGYQIAGIGSRFLACALDTVLIIVMMLFVNFALAAFVRAFDLLAGEGQDAGAWLAAIFGLLNFAVFWGYYIFFETVWSGQTPGKRRNGLRVIRRDGTPVTVSETVVRNLVRLIDFMPALYAVGVATMFVDGQSRRLGDLAANTLVVRDRESIALSSLDVSLSAPAGRLSGPSMNDSLPVDRLSAQEIALLEEYFRRRYEFANRDEVAARLVRTLCSRMDIAAPPMKAGQAEELLSDIWQSHRRPKTL